MRDIKSALIFKIPPTANSLLNALKVIRKMDRDFSSLSELGLSDLPLAVLILKEKMESRTECLYNVQSFRFSSI